MATAKTKMSMPRAASVMWKTCHIFFSTFNVDFKKPQTSLVALSYEHGCTDLKKQPLERAPTEWTDRKPPFNGPACALRIKASVMATHYNKSTIPKVPWLMELP